MPQKEQNDKDRKERVRILEEQTTRSNIQNRRYPRKREN